MRATRALGSAVATGSAAAVCGLVMTGRLGLDLGWGRSTRRLGPITEVIDARRSVVFDVIAEPYLGRTTRATSAKLRVLERGSDMVLAEHFTPLLGGLVATTTETVTFERPDRIRFRLVRGPVPEVHEEFVLAEAEGQTRLEYTGELAADLWALGRGWGKVVARKWEATVKESLGSIKVEAERRERGRRGARQ